MTSNGGQYAFAGLAEGTYVVTMIGWDEVAYTFETTSATIVLGDAESNITNFEGTHTRTASISGVLFIDEVMQDKMHTAGEPSLTAHLRRSWRPSGVLDPGCWPLLGPGEGDVAGSGSQHRRIRWTSTRSPASRHFEGWWPGPTRCRFPPTTRWWRRHSQAAGVASVGESIGGDHRGWRAAKSYGQLPVPDHDADDQRRRRDGHGRRGE